MTLIISPTAANGMFNQLRLPRHGKKAIIIPMSARIPQINDIVAILTSCFLFCDRHEDLNGRVHGICDKDGIKGDPSPVELPRGNEVEVGNGDKRSRHPAKGTFFSAL